MAIVLGPNRYGKAETRVLRVVRGTARHEVRDLNVSTSLSGDFAAAHVAGDQAHVLPTDTQKNTVFAYADDGIGHIEEFAAGLARHFVDDVAPVRTAEVRVEEHPWERIADHDHAFRRTGAEVSTTRVVADADGHTVTSGLRDLVVLKSTGSEFAGFLVDELTTLPPTSDRVLATSLSVEWAYRTGATPDWGATRDGVRTTLLDRFAHVHSLALQQSLWEMGRAALEAHAEVASIDLVAPNIHHVAVDLTPFGRENRGQVFHVTDRPYGLIEVTVERDGD